jgi:hypothetical protein
MTCARTLSMRRNACRSSWTVCYFCPIVNNTLLNRHILVNLSFIRFHGHPVSDLLLLYAGRQTGVLLQHSLYYPEKLLLVVSIECYVCERVCSVDCIYAYSNVGHFLITLNWSEEYDSLYITHATCCSLRLTSFNQRNEAGIFFELNLR